jgi:hypothetical protein
MASKQSYINLADAIKNKTLSSITIPEQNVIDVSLMFDIPTDADVSAWMFRSEIEDNNLIHLYGYDNSGSEGELVITPELGFGSHYDAKIAQMSVNDEDEVVGNVIVLAKDDGETPGTITIPAGCNNFDISYYQTKDGGYRIPSWYITTADVMHPFELSNTPFNNFNTQNNTNVIINGVTVAKSTIKEISFGESYAGVTDFGGCFLRYYTSLQSAQSVHYSQLSKATIIGQYFMANNTGMQSVDLSPLVNVTNISHYFLDYCISLQSLDFSSFGNVTSIGDSFCGRPSSLTSIQVGSVDWTNISISKTSGFESVTNDASRVIYADTLELGNTFKAKHTRLNKWTVVAN